MARLELKKWAQVELNNVAFRRDGRIEAQCKLNETQFKDKPAENGMILMVDKAKNEIVLPNGKDLPYALHYSSEHMYDERANSLKDFALFPGTFLPRMGYLAVGDLFTTNCVSSEMDMDALKAAPTLYGAPSADGSIAITSTKPESDLILKVVKVYTMPNGEPGLKFQVIKA